MCVADTWDVFLTDKESNLFGTHLACLPNGLAVTAYALCGLALIEPVLGAELTLIGWRVLASPCFLGKALVEGAWVSVVAILLRARRADTVLARVVFRALAAILASRGIEGTQATSDRIAGIIGALVVIVADDWVESLTCTVNAFICLGTDTSVIA